MQVLEGAEFHELRDCLSIPHSKSSNLDSSILTNGITNSAEIESLKTVINTMKADILALKQEYLDLKNSTTKEVQEVKESVKKLQVELQMEIYDLRGEVKTNAQSIDRIVDEKSNCNASLKSDIRLIKAEVKELQDALVNKAESKTVENINEKHAQILKRLNKLERNNVSNSYRDNSSAEEHKQENTDKQSTGQTIQNNTKQNNDTRLQYTAKEDCVIVDGHDTENTCSPSKKDVDKDRSYADVLQGKEIESDKFMFESQSSRYLQSHSQNNPERFSSFRQFDRIQDKQRSNTYTSRGNRHAERSDLSNDVHAPSYLRLNESRTNMEKSNSVDRNNRFPRPQRITRGRGTRQDASENSNEVDEDDFSKYVYRRVKRFYVGGFINSITTDKLVDYVETRGVTVTWVTIFPIRNSNRVVIRLNVEDNDNSDFVLERTFWPRYVICKPWLTRNTRERRRNNRQIHSYNTVQNDYQYDIYNEENDDYYDDNRYNDYNYHHSYARN